MGVCMHCNKVPLYTPDKNPLIERNSINYVNQPSLNSKANPKKHINPVIDERNSYETSKEAISATITSKPKTEHDIKLILNVLKNHFIFNSIDKESQLAIIKKVKCYEIEAKQTIFERGEPGECFFVISSGKLEVKTNKEKSVLVAGESFGELALLDDRPRTATVRTLEFTVLWGLNRKSFMKAIKKIRMHEYKENKIFINSVNIFSILTNDQKEAILGACITQKWAAGQVIIKEGDNGDLFYIIKEGIAIINPEKNDCREIQKGDYFGEHALLYKQPRLATVIALTDLKLISIGRESLFEVLGNNFEYILFKNSQRIALERSSSLKSLSHKQRESILEKTVITKYSVSEVIIREGTLKNARLWIVVKGRVKGKKSGKMIERLECIGDESITNKVEEKYEEDFEAVSDSDLAEISREDIEVCIGGEISQVTIHNDAIGVLRQVQLLRGLSADKINELTMALKIKNFEDQQVIVQQNNPGNSFFIIKNGSVKVFRNEKYIRNITKNDYFGERSVLFNDFRTATVIADGQVTCWILERDDFMSIISEKIRERLIKRIELQDSSVFLEELIPIKSIGTGALGNVILVAHKHTKTLFAVKSLARSRIEKYQIQSFVVLEKNILMELDHIMIIKLIKTFKDDLRIYFLMEFVRGKDLFDILLEFKSVSEEQAKFYAECLVVTLEYLHERNIIHRDLKPENIMIDEEGYTKLIDFHAATIVEGRTYTAIGTPHYLPPEIILRIGYSFGVDWWSLGILLHELVYGFVPFGEEDEDPILIYQKILENRLEFKNLPYKSNHFKAFLTQLLNKNPSVRTCGGFSYLKNNPWFGNVNWDRLMSRQLRPPFSPKLEIFTEEIEKAIEKNQQLDEFLENIEASQSDLIYKKRTQKFQEKHWDENF